MPCYVDMFNTIIPMYWLDIAAEQTVTLSQRAACYNKKPTILCAYTLCGYLNTTINRH